VAKPASKRKYWIWTGVGVGFLIVFGGISYWALSVGSTQGTSIRPGQPTLQMQGSVIDAPALSSSKKAAQSTATETPAITETPVTVAKVREATPQPAAVPVASESDEAYYDRMALEAGKESSSIPVIPEPTPAPVHVVEPRVEDDRIVTSEQFTSATAEMRKNSSEMSELLGAVKQVQSAMSEMKKQIDINAAKTSDLGTQLATLNGQVGSISKNYDAKLNAVTKESVAAAVAAVSNKERGAGKEGRLTLVGGPLVPTSGVKAHSQREAIVPSTEVQRNDLPQPKPAPVEAVTRSVVSQPAQCAAKSISQIWHVKGVGPMAAYIRRDSDGVGFLVKMDEEVPGFGIVKGFDPTARTVCTDKGLIVR
jgi:hypothetical protein